MIVDESSCSDLGWSTTCLVQEADTWNNITVHYVTFAPRLTQWTDNGVYVKNAVYMWCDDPGRSGCDTTNSVQAQGKTGWTPKNPRVDTLRTPPVLVHAPNLGYTVDMDTGDWTSTTASGSLPDRNH